MKCKVAGLVASNSNRKEKNNNKKQNHTPLNSASVGTARTSSILLSIIHLYYSFPDSCMTGLNTESPVELGRFLRSWGSQLLPHGQLS